MVAWYRLSVSRLWTGKSRVVRRLQLELRDEFE